MATLPAIGVNKRLVIARENEYGKQAAGPGQLVRRVNEAMNLSIDSYANQEIITSQQVRDVRHGVHRVAGSLTGNLAPGAFKEILQVLLRRDFAAGAAASGSIGAVDHGFSRSGGSFITDGFRIGDVVRSTGWSGAAVANNNMNFRIVDLIDSTMSVAEDVAAGGSGSTLTCPGKTTWIPASGQTDHSFTLERYFTDLGQSETFLGCKPSQVQLNIPGSGFVSMTAMIEGQDMIAAAAPTYPSPAEQANDPATVAATGGFLINGHEDPIVTGVQLTIATQMQPQPVVGSNFIPFLPYGRISVGGQMTAYFDSQELMMDFMNETEISLAIMLRDNAALNADFVTLYMPSVKLQSASKSDSDSSLFQTIAFQAIESFDGIGGHLQSTIGVQDSTLV